MSRNENENLKLENKRFHAEYIRMIEDIENTKRKEQEQRDEIEQLKKNKIPGGNSRETLG